MKRHHLLATAALMLFTAPAIATAQTPTPTKTVTAQGPVAQQDMTFAEKAAVSDMFEVQAGKLAQDNAKEQRVKQFGGQMVSDHTKTSDAMKAMAQQKSMTLPTKLDSEHQQKLDHLRSLKGDQFDSAYLQGQIDAHRTAVALFREQSQNGKDADLKRFASETLPTLEQHLRHVQELRPGVASASSATQPQTSFEKMMGKDVYGQDGKKLGDVADIILDPQSGNATVVVLNRGGVLGIGAKQVAIGYNMLNSQGDRIVASNVTEDQVKQMSEFKYDDTTVSLGRNGNRNAAGGSGTDHGTMNGGASHGDMPSGQTRNPQ
ncbi:DUF4142 domain-containing protein [Azospirillum picis]|uniref:Membrane protein n=1 Tax=Azospirillum picis TaxID=488438 RepID=A0ABU0MJK4_9PROT|nr:DUF4142 domain-containing protein [Azospirillum picis]MBP2299829.1 putative membrane protein [Azospirillum picis]MDQ0533625.1 putative membrane protein [Azospirillum picis]